MSDLADRLEDKAKTIRIADLNSWYQELTDDLDGAAARLRKLEAGLIRTHDLIKQGRYQAADAELKALSACGDDRLTPFENDDGDAEINDCTRHGWRGPGFCPYCRAGLPEFEECHHGATGFCSDCYEEGFGD